MNPNSSKPIKNQRAQHGLVLGFFACGALGLAGNVFAQFCPGATTYFTSNYSLPSCSVGTCWSATPFTGSTAVTGNTYPGTNRYTYDGANNLTQVSDSLGSATSYTYDGLNNLTKLVSPDTGTTNNTYDAAGNL